MDFAKLAKARYSVRKFKADSVPDEALGQILEAGRVAPTACNYQPQRTVVIRGEEALAALRDCTPFHFDAPCALLVCVDREKSWKRSHFDGKDSGDIDAAIAATHMMLQAADLGLGTTWVMVFDPDKARAAFRIPESVEPVALLPLGYPADDCAPSVMHEQCLDLSETVVHDHF